MTCQIYGKDVETVLIIDLFKKLWYIGRIRNLPVSDYND